MLNISDITVISVIDNSTFLFTCESIYGKDPVAQLKLCLIDDYWGCHKPSYAPFIRKSEDGTLAFVGRLRRDYKASEPVMAGTEGQLVHITEDSCFKDVKVHVSPRVRAGYFEVEINLPDHNHTGGKAYTQYWALVA